MSTAGKMKSPRYDSFINALSDLNEGGENLILVRKLTPGQDKYVYRQVRAMVSSDLNKYDDALLLRFGRGQEHPNLWSIKVLSEVPRIPERYL